MGSTFMGLEIAKRGLATHQQALQTTGHNISNADNKNYARQRVVLTSMAPLYNPSLNRSNGPGMIGQGVEISRIERVRDAYVDDRIFEGEQTKSYWQNKQKYLQRLEGIYNEPSDQSIRSQLDRFWQSWQELSQFPEELSHREMVRTRGKELAFQIRDTFQRMDSLRREADFELQATVKEINSLASQIRELNEKILKSETLGDSPNDLMDKRDELFQRLSQLADVSVRRDDPDEMIVYLGGEILVQGEVQHELKLEGDPSNEGLHKITWAHNGKETLFKNGKAQSLLDVRDGVLKENIDKIDLLAVNVADIVNEVHRDGFGLTKETNLNFFHIDPIARNIRGNYDSNGDGTDDISAIFRVAGRNKVEADRPVGLSGTITLHRNDANSTPVYINYRADETLKSVVERINRSDAGVVAYINHNNNLVLKGRIAEDDWQKNFMIRHIEDSGELLVGFAGLLQNSGPAGAFDYNRIDEINKFQSDLDRITMSPRFHPAGALQLSAEVEGNAALIATASGKDVGGTGDLNSANGAKDGSNALRIAQALKHDKTMVGQYNTPDDFYNAVISKAGIESRTASEQLQNQELILKNLENTRQSLMGVNLDEEMANMVQFQHSYNAAAKMIKVLDDMLNRIINQLI